MRRTLEPLSIKPTARSTRGEAIRPHEGQWFPWRITLAKASHPMGAAFREVFATFGVDGDLTPPAMMVPLHGYNLVALEGGQDLSVIPERDNLKVEKLDQSKLAQQMVLANHQSAKARGSRLLSDDARFFRISGAKTVGLKGTLLKAVSPQTPKKVEASLLAVVLGERLINIAIRAVKTRDDKGNWVPHAKIEFDSQALCDQMNSIWTPQSNVKFKLVSSEPLLIEEKELAEELNRTKLSKATFLDEVHIEAFDPLFRRHQIDKADFTIFMVKSILCRPLDHPNLRGTHPAGATPAKSSFCLVCDKMASDPVREARHLATIPGTVPAHEAGHFMGLDNHVIDQSSTMLMVEGGPIAGFGKVTLDQTTRIFNKNYS